MKHAASIALAAALLLSACAQTPGDLPGVHYAAAVSQGGVPTFLAGRPTLDQVAIAEEKWSRAVSDSFSCGIRKNDVFEAGMVGALELSVMTSLARGGGKLERDRALAGYATKVLTLSLSGGDRPRPERCAELRAWVPQVRSDGKAALKRARDNGELDNLKIRF